MSLSTAGKLINKGGNRDLLGRALLLLPQTETASELYKNAGFWLLLCAALFWFIENYFYSKKTDSILWGKIK